MEIMEVRLTKKKLGDLRFRKNEEAICRAFFDENGENYNINQLVQRAGIDKATFYRHHQTVFRIIEDYEYYILREYNGLVDEIRKVI